LPGRSCRESEFSSAGAQHPHIDVNRIGDLQDAMRFRSATTTQGNGTMTNKLALAASLMMLTTISGQAFAKSAATSDQQAVYAATAFDHNMATDTDAATAYHYHGGPKYND
jgi:hypothetical protein